MEQDILVKHGQIYVTYHKGWHGYAVLVGTVDGIEGKIKFPTCAF